MKIASLLNAKINIVDYIGKYTELKPAGNTYRGRCPIHGSNEGEPLVVYPNTNTYYCFACESGGGPISFVSDMENIPYSAAMETLAKEYNIDLGSKEEYKKMLSIEQRYTKRAQANMNRVDDVIEYLHSRGFTDETIKKFELGSENGKISIPIRNEFGQMCALAYRQFDAKPKYRNSYNNDLYDKSALLYGLDKSRKMLKNVKAMYIVEGYLDAISGIQMGLPTVAFCSAELHQDQIFTLSRFIKSGVEIIYCPDNDEEGLKYIDRVRDKFKSIMPRTQVRVLVMPDDMKDMNDLLKAGVSIDELETMNIDKFVALKLVKRCKTVEEEYDFIRDFIRTVSNPILKSDILQMMATRWNKPYDELKEVFKVSVEDTERIVSDISGVQDCLNDLRHLYEREVFKTHFQQWDNCIGGLEKKDVVVIGAYSGNGKTDMALEFILRQISRNKCRTVFFSLEMPKGKIMERLIAKIVGCRLREVREIVKSNDERINTVIEKLNNYLYVYDKNDCSMTDIDKTITTLNSQGILGGPVDLVVLDYFTYLKGANTREGASEQALMLKGMAKKHNIIFLILSQVNRTGNTYLEPTMDMLKMTGDLEASADHILMMWRPDKQPDLSLEEQQRLQYQTQAKVEKARGGTDGPTRLSFKYDPNTSRLVEEI